MTDRQKAELSRNVTDLIVKETKQPKQYTWVIVHEVPAENWMVDWLTLPELRLNSWWIGNNQLIYGWNQVTEKLHPLDGSGYGSAFTVPEDVVRANGFTASDLKTSFICSS